MNPIYVILIIFAIIIVVGVAVSISNQNERGRTIVTAKDSLTQNGFTISKQVTDTENNYSLLVDDSNHNWAIINARLGTSTLYDYSDLIEYEILEDGNSVVKGRVGSAIVGGLLFGGIGAIAGATRSKKVKNTCKSMSVNIVVDNLERPRILIPLVTTETKTDSFIYKIAAEKAQEFASVLSIIKSRAEQDNSEIEDEIPSSTLHQSSSDEIERYYALMEKGIITKDEFEKKKKQLLEL